MTASKFPQGIVAIIGRVKRGGISKMKCRVSSQYLKHRRFARCDDLQAGFDHVRFSCWWRSRLPNTFAADFPTFSLIWWGNKELQCAFFKNNGDLLKEFGRLNNLESSEKFLLEHPHLASDFSASFLTIEALNLAVQLKVRDLFKDWLKCICPIF